MIFSEGPRGISPFPSGLGVARPRSEPRLLAVWGVLPVPRLRAAPPILVALASSNRCRSGSAASRSEEHTSELQSQSNLVCRLLLEKKKHLRYPPTSARPTMTAALATLARPPGLSAKRGPCSLITCSYATRLLTSLLPEASRASTCP